MTWTNGRPEELPPSSKLYESPVSVFWKVIRIGEKGVVEQLSKAKRSKKVSRLYFSETNTANLGGSFYYVNTARIICMSIFTG